ncbi:MAG: hypothetical protein U0V75_00905 [Ferruginibacter sp.]
MKQIVGALLLVVCSISGYGQIGQKVKGPAIADLPGTWFMKVPNGNTVTLLLMANGSAELDGDAMTWTTSNNILQLKSGTGIIKYTYKQNGNNLILSGGDLSQPATFVRNNAANSNASSSNGSGDPALLGSWQAQGMLFTFENGGKMFYNDKTMDYTVNGNTLHCVNTQAGVEVTYQYQINQDHLLLNYNGNTMMLQKKSGTGVPANNAAADNRKPGFLGNWVSTNNEHLTMMDGGRMTLEGYDLTYTYDASTITITAPAGNVVFAYTLSGNNFNVTNNGVTTYYKRAAGNNNAAAGNGVNAAGGIDPTMVGRWGVMNSGGGGYNSQGTYSSGEYFILNANGTYQYYSESSRSATNDAGYGGTSSNGYDEGTWTVKGNVLVANSRQRGVQQYPFQKRNNKNGDPCIVINGTEYVSYYQKAPWR